MFVPTSMWHWLYIFKVKLLLEQRFSNYCITAPRVTKNLLIKKIEQQLSHFFVNNTTNLELISNIQCNSKPSKTEKRIQ